MQKACHIVGLKPAEPFADVLAVLERDAGDDADTAEQPGEKEDEPGQGQSVLERRLCSVQVPLGSGFGDLVYATVPLGSVATKVARDWLANELYEPSRRGKIDAACRDRKVADLITAAGASAPADAVFGGRFATGETPRPTTSASEASAWRRVGGDGGNGVEYFDLFEPDPTPMEDL
ncbi:hypothetical protein EMIHUDRAFT_237000 [Emiliania huxleyi CCMP1516]|uniref:Uncharacterized protein n=2 Tax=Emiliania huxleyi TaxID=2903 RepID=A0A0D3JRQ2_EMIH1|nr:hypothetical protein EMIHUDRAFT_237000 [Emiliania huxleyi CCMP1516]EOD26187.1 hypothetical protein EMIHUDRAFT_237000 [Emiliania huxleyi CCMP1516]|eukprot:XP_005778616.1 hypothetical protein EMIHUDRAFT_237000 [Emiliania huxleyi CCMP1516]